jgi:hypothetical protein
MRDNRRKDERFNLSLPVKWDGMSGAHETRIEDISLGGCFVNSPARVDVGEVVSIELRLPSGEWLPLRGEVTACQPGIGFGLEFSFLTEEEDEALRELLS